MRVVVVIALLVLVACSAKKKRVLPMVGNFDIEYKTVDGKEVADTIYPTIPAFEYLNQDSALVKSGDMKGKIWVADFFFSTCPTICPVMTTQMKRLNAMTEDLSEHIQFISFSINPDHDQPHVLKRYKEHYGIQAKNWQFFTGDEAETHLLGVTYFMVHANADEEAPGGYAHSPAFTLVDKEGYVRGVYIGTDTEQVDQLEKDIRKLLKYEYDVK